MLMIVGRVFKNFVTLGGILALGKLNLYNT